MLYISRKTGEHHYGVVDTDDGVETIVTDAEIRSVVFKYGIKIEGVLEGHRNDSLYLIRPVHGPGSQSKLQLKWKALYGIDVVIYDEEIQYVSRDDIVYQKDIALRVSDLACKFSGHALLMINGNQLLTFVVDDKVEFTHCLPQAGFGAFNIGWDISELSNDGLADVFYRCFLRGMSMEFSDWDRFVKDRPGRGDWARYACFVKDTQVHNAEEYKKLLFRPDYAVISERVFDYFSVEFTQICETDILHSLFVSMPIEDFKHLVEDMLAEDISWAATCKDFERLSTEFLGVCRFLKLVSTIHSYSLTCMENYIRYFKSPKRMQALFIKLCNTTATDVGIYIRKGGKIALR